MDLVANHYRLGSLPAVMNDDALRLLRWHLALIYCPLFTLPAVGMSSVSSAVCCLFCPLSAVSSNVCCALSAAYGRLSPRAYLSTFYSRLRLPAS